MTASWICLALLLLCGAVMTLVFASPLGLAYILLLSLCSASAIISSRIISPDIKVGMRLDKSCNAGDECFCNVHFTNMRILPYRRLRVRLCAVNMLTGEKISTVLKCSLRPKGKAVAFVKLYSEHCGQLKVYIKEMRIYDAMGLTWRSIPCGVCDEVTVIPELFSTNTDICSTFFAPESEEYFQDIPGDDKSQVFDMREYAPGDEIRNINRKLSLRHEKLIIKRGSRPYAAKLCLCTDSCGCTVPADLDKMGRYACSFALSLYEKGIAFEVVDGNSQVYVDSEAALDSAMPLLLTGNEGGLHSVNASGQMLCVVPPGCGKVETDVNAVTLEAADGQ